MLKKVMGLLLLCLAVVAFPLAVSAASDDLQLSPDNFPPDATMETYTIIRGTFIGDNDADLTLGYVTFSADDFIGIMDADAPIVSDDGLWLLTAESVTVVRGTTATEEQALAYSLENLADPHIIISSMVVSRVSRTFFPSGGSVTIPTSIYHVHIVPHSGRVYSGNISRVDWEVVLNSQGDIVRAYGFFSGTIHHRGLYILRDGLVPYGGVMYIGENRVCLGN